MIENHSSKVTTQLMEQFQALEEVFIVKKVKQVVFEIGAEKATGQDLIVPNNFLSKHMQAKL